MIKEEKVLWRVKSRGRDKRLILISWVYDLDVGTADENVKFQAGFELEVYKSDPSMLEYASSRVLEIGDLAKTYKQHGEIIQGVRRILI